MNATPLQIFIACVNGYTGTPNNKVSIQEAQVKREKLLKCSAAVEASAILYEQTIPHRGFREPDLPVEKQDLAKVYKEKFSADDGPGRPYYELIRGEATCGTCPICGGKGGITELDHYLPKSEYPTLCVNPNNLIPICDSCNKEKKNKKYSVEEGMPLHLYVDRLPMPEDEFDDPEPFLYADINADFVATFRVQCPPGWDPDLQRRLENHMKAYNLAERYRVCARDEYPSIHSLWKKRMVNHVKALAEKIEVSPEKQKQLYRELMGRIDKTALLHDIIKTRAEDASNDVNSWQSALYRALESRVTELAQWLESEA